MSGGDPTHVQILRNALDMELSGREFFERASQSVKNERTKRVFQSLAEQEKKHIDVISAELARLEEGHGWASLQDVKAKALTTPGINVFHDRGFKHLKLRPEAGELEALEVGMDVERKSIDYYRSAAVGANDVKARQVFNWLVGEESGHLVILSAEHDSRSGAGFHYGSSEFSLEVM